MCVCVRVCVCVCVCVSVTHMRIEKALREKRNDSGSTMVCFLCAQAYMWCKCVCVVS